jgi:hypothetical protein
MPILQKLCALGLDDVQSAPEFTATQPALSCQTDLWFEPDFRIATRLLAARTDMDMRWLACGDIETDEVKDKA